MYKGYGLCTFLFDHHHHHDTGNCGAVVLAGQGVKLLLINSCLRGAVSISDAGGAGYQELKVPARDSS